MPTVQICHDVPHQKNNKKKKIKKVLKWNSDGHYFWSDQYVLQRDPIAFEGEQQIWFPNHPHHSNRPFLPLPLPHVDFPIQWSPFQTTC